MQEDFYKLIRSLFYLINYEFMNEAQIFSFEAMIVMLTANIYFFTLFRWIQCEGIQNSTVGGS